MDDIKLENDIKKTLYVRFPRKITNMDEVRDIFPGDVQIKLPRQSARHAVVVFPTVEDAHDALEACKNIIIDDKRVQVRLLKPNMKIQPEKKLKIKKKQLQFKPTRSVLVKNIPLKTTMMELKQAFRDCRSASFMLTSQASTNMQAIVKFHSPDIANDYLTGKTTALVRESQVKILPDTRTKKKPRQGLKVWDGDEDVTDKFVFKDSSSNSKLKNQQKTHDDVKADEDSE